MYQTVHARPDSPVWWVAETPDNTYELGTDTFFVRHGKIAVQTFAFKATPRA